LKANYGGFRYGDNLKCWLLDSHFMVALQQIREGNLVDDSDFEYNDDFGY
jgi:hypothetical protein